MIELIKSIQYLSSFIWLLVPIRQFKTRFFFFFLVLGLLDPLAFISHHFFKFNTTVLYLLGTILLLYPALFELGKKIKLSIILFLLTASLIVVFYSMPVSIIIQMVIHFIIFITFLKVLVIYFSENRKLLLFHLMLVMYEFSLLLKFFVYYHEVEVGPTYYIVTTAIQIMIGIFFIFFNEVHSPKLSM